MEYAWRIGSAALASYALGSIPFAILVGRLFWGEDIRHHGSGNTGATNVLRVFGPAPGFLVLALDALKGAAAVWIAAALAAPAWGMSGHDWMSVLGATVAVAGHSFSPFIGFSGGKGVATAAGAIVVAAPQSAAVMVAVFLIVVGIWHMVSLGSITIAALFPLVTALLYPGRTALIVFAVFACVLVIWRHRSNIGRIARGEESKITFKRRLWDEVRKRRQGGDA
ncbi:MAG: glycerol-3-phosphate 1-O-acyltransferase PlsY [Coriobacteriia bacterium]